MSRKVTLKHGKKKHKGFVIEESESFEDFQAKVFSVTLVPTERQKLVSKGKSITDDKSLSAVKRKAIVIVIGTAEAVSTHTTATATFIEDMSEADKHLAAAVLPVGLHNLGNTCYLNATLQCLAGIAPLRDALRNHAISHSSTPTCSTSLGKLLLEMNSVSDSVVPNDFVKYFRGVYPRFAEMSERGGYKQQDADEFLTEVIAAMRTELKTRMPPATSAMTATDSGGKFVVNELFQGEFETVTALEEMEGGVDLEPAQLNFEEFIKLRCFMDASTRHIRDGIAKDCEQKFEKTSATLGRMANYSRKRRISKLPKFLTVQIVRFFWKASKQTNSKVLRAVEFPHEWDIFEFCGDSLQSKITKYRDILEDREEKARTEKMSDVTVATDSTDTAAAVTSATVATVTTTTTTTADASVVGDADVEMTGATEDEEKKDATISDVDISDLESGYYELVGLVTHKGLSANSGHYIGYAKYEKHGWVKFNDDVVTNATPEDIQKLYGGGQWQMGYICFYRKKEAVL